MNRPDIRIFDKIIDASMMLSEGNTEAMRILHEFMQHEKLWVLMYLDDMNMRGDQIVIAYNNWCVGDYKIFETCISNGDEDMIKFINRESPSEHIVVKSGGSKSENRKTKENYNVIQFKKSI